MRLALTNTNMCFSVCLRYTSIASSSNALISLQVKIFILLSSFGLLRVTKVIKTQLWPTYLTIWDNKWKEHTFIGRTSSNNMFNMDEQKYYFSNPNICPIKPIHRNIKVWTYYRHSRPLIWLAYYLTEGQLAKSLLLVGVMMYVLTEHDLILLDCCYIGDSTIAKAGNLETYLNINFINFNCKYSLLTRSFW